MSKRTKGEGTIRKRSDGRWEGRYVNCIGETKYTKEEREKHDRDFEKILKTYKILGENETIKHEE